MSRRSAMILHNNFSLGALAAWRLSLSRLVTEDRDRQIAWCCLCPGRPVNVGRHAGKTHLRPGFRAGVGGTKIAIPVSVQTTTQPRVEDGEFQPWKSKRRT